ncbi:MAG: hypothetical protein HQP61_02275 [Peptococcaceae bacterium]|nr:hypothetical protein [Candidatus Syntrophopropionicum ammoniitolerans]
MIGRMKIIWSTMQEGKKSLRSRDGGNVRDELAGFKPGADVVIVEESVLKQLMERVTMQHAGMRLDDSVADKTLEHLNELS